MKAFLIVSVLCVAVYFAPARAEDGLGFTEQEATIIREVFEELVLEPVTGQDFDKKDSAKKDKGADASKGLPPGLAKRGELPPGLEKHIRERGTLPSGLAKRELPDDIYKRLALEKGRELVWIDDDVYLVETATEIVLDVLKDVAR